MHQLNKEDFFPAGTIIKPHGLKGDMILEIEEGFEEYLSEQECLLVGIEGGLVPFFITEDGFNFRTSTTLSVAFEDYNSADKVRPLCGCKVYLHNEADQEETTDDSFNELMDYIVFDKEKGKLGKIIHIDNYSGNVVLTVEHFSHEILIPLSEGLITSISNEKQEIHLDCPEGLIDLYLG